MTPAGRLSASIEILDALDKSGRPADQVASAYFRNRRYIGSKDRRWISESVFRVLRSKARLDWLLNSINVDPIDARARVLADLVVEGGSIPDKEMFEGPYAATPPDELDRRMMDRLHKQSLFHRDMPLWVKSEYPQWLEPKLQQAFGDDLLKEMGAMRDEAPLDLRVNTLKATRE
jgi:16S rRNA (cytosine967-C5)-methyltransferase